MKTIIIYSTKHGTTTKAASMLKSKLPDDVTMVNISKEKAPDIAGYDTVLLGGSFYVGSIQRKLTDFITANKQTLLNKRLGLFSCASSEKEWMGEFEKAFPQELRNHALAAGNFGYEFDFKKMNFLEKVIIGKVAGVKESVFKLSPKNIEAFANAFVS